MSSAVWVGVALALLVWPQRRRQGVELHAPLGGRTTSPRQRQQLTSAVAGVAVATLCVVLFGGVAGLAGGAVAGPLAVVMVRRVGSPGVRAGSVDPSLPLVLDLAAAVLRSGRPVPDALALAAPAASSAVSEALLRTARLLELGADPALAWVGGDRAAPSRQSAVLAPVAEVAIRSHSSGARLAGTFERLAAELRTERAAAARARAERAGVQAMGPLAACFLPSFVCLGIVPVIVGVASTVLKSVT